MDAGKLLVEAAVSLVVEKGAAAVVNSRAGEAAKRQVQNAVAKAHDQMLANIEHFARIVAAKVGERRSNDGARTVDPSGALQDPDALHAYGEAAVSASRTSSPERHSLLAELVSARFSQQTDTLKAIASNDAIAVATRLSQPQLNALGILAVVHFLRPSDSGERARLARASTETFNRDIKGRTVQEGDRTAYNLLSAQMSDERTEYANWILGQLEHYAATSTNPTDVAHLSSTGCLLIERETQRDLATALSRPLLHSSDHACSMDASTLSRRLYGEGWKWLRSLWTGSLEHCLPTPAGLLLGCAVHDTYHNGAMQQWEWSDPVVPDLSRKPRSPSVWDGQRHINSTFVRELLRVTEEEKRRWR